MIYESQLIKKMSEILERLKTIKNSNKIKTDSFFDKNEK